MIVTFKSRRMRARNKARIRVHEDFVPKMRLVEAIAEKWDVMVFVTQSLRDPEKEVTGAVVTPAVMSNHLVGHACDFNVISSDGSWYNSKKLGRMRYLPDDIRGFIQDIRDHPELRWGGDFNTPDVIHWDDMLNKTDPEEWHRKFKEIWT